jgi:predicted CopG family antitoxin
MKNYTKIKVLRISETQYNTLVKMKSYKVDVSQFIRDAIGEKIQREYKDLIPKPKTEYIPF